MVYYVYFIKTLDGYPVKTYVGYTNNLNKRLEKHNSNLGAKSTRGYQWEFVYKKKFYSKQFNPKKNYFLLVKNFLFQIIKMLKKLKIYGLLKKLYHTVISIKNSYEKIKENPSFQYKIK